MPTAINPGRITVPKPTPPGLWNPCPILGNKYVKTNTNISGFITVRIRKAMNSRRSTLRSRSNMPQNARHCRPELFTQVPPGKFDKDGLQCGLVYGDIAQVVFGNFDNSRQNAVAAGGKDAKAFGEALNGRYVPQLPQTLCQRGAINLPQVQLKDLLRSDATL